MDISVITCYYFVVIPDTDWTTDHKNPFSGDKFLSLHFIIQYLVQYFNHRLETKYYESYCCNNNLNNFFSIPVRLFKHKHIA